MTIVVLCGGSGTRLWPLSQPLLPKPFLPLTGERSLFQETVLRNRPWAERVIVAASLAHRNLVETQLANLSPFSGLWEPVAKGTLTPLVLACLALPADELVLATPSDDLITNQDEYASAVDRACVLARQGAIVLLGVPASAPETGLGYIEHDGETVLSFREKPRATVAEALVATGRWLWNSGLSVFRAGDFLEEVRAQAPQVLAVCRRVVQPLAPTAEELAPLPAISVDYALWEHSTRLRVVSGDLGWSDLGTYDALANAMSENAQRNGVWGPVKPVFLDSYHNFVVSHRRPIALVDVADLIVVDTPHGLVISKRGSGQRIKEVVGLLGDQQVEEGEVE